MEDLYSLTFSEEFMQKWKFVLRKLYNYKFYEEFAVVPSLWGKKTYSYLPLLNYTDRTSRQVSDLLVKLKKKDYQMRVLNPDCKEFQDFDTVTMRIDLQKKDIEELFRTVVSKRNRRYIRQLNEERTVVKKGSSAELIQDFYDIFAAVMHRHGTPVFSRRLFELLSQNLETTIYVLYDNNIPQSGAVILDDKQISWIPWSGTRSQYLDNRPGLFVYWETIKDAFFKHKLIYDFGRSSYGGGTYIFKTRWSAVPVKIDVIQPRPGNVYKKYSYASQAWKKIPPGFARWLGPKVCKYLSDL
jgi:lipid II:glycine glycyltransferase (peptidoglycan interpeptide bridge formation enzyme)